MDLGLRIVFGWSLTGSLFGAKIGIEEIIR
jgi:hypothetical protein